MLNKIDTFELTVAERMLDRDLSGAHIRGPAGPRGS